MNVLGGNGDDNISASLFVARGNVDVSGGNGNDAIEVGVQYGYNDIDVSGGNGNDDIDVDVLKSSGNASVVGGVGNDDITVGVFRGLDHIDISGDDGNDAIDVGVKYGYNDIDVLGGNGNDNINASLFLARDDVDVSGGNGHDAIEVGVKYGYNDIDVSGGNGNDDIDVDVLKSSGNASVAGGGGDDDITVGVFRGLDHIDISGDDGNDAIDVGVKYGYNDIDVLGGNGNDNINASLFTVRDNVDVSGGNGNDAINVGVQYGYNDIDVSGGNGNDDISARVYVIKGDVAVAGGAGDDSINVDVGLFATSVTVSGGDGNDDVQVSGNATEAFTVLGGSGNDKLTNVGTDRVTMDGGDGSDVLWGGAGNDTLYGGAGNDYLHGEDDVDYDKLRGGTGSDVLYGGVADLIDGGEDDDILVGIDGSTRFVGGPGLNIIIDGRGLNYTVNNTDGGVDKYAVCAYNHRGRDWGCLAGFTCKLSDGRSPGHRQAGDQCLPACYANQIPVENESLIAPYSCSTSLIFKASYILSFATCNYNDTLDVLWVRELVAAWLGFPRCQVGVSIALGSSSTRRRRLLQLGELAEDQIEIVIEAFASAEGSIQSIADLFLSADFTAFLAGLFELFGDVAEVVLGAPVSLVDLSSATSDPHFVSARGDRFDFVGRAQRSYCVLSDERVHVNARLMGADGASGAAGGASIKAANARRVPNQNGEAHTWMDQISVMYGSDRVLVDADSRPGAPYAASFGTVLLNGVPLEGKLGTRRLPSGLVVTRRNTRVYISAPGIMEMVVEVVRAAFWEANKGPGKNFLNFQVKEFKAVGAVHGILGQSFSKQGAEVPMEGTDEDYATSGVFAADCRFAKFVAQ
eukprot:jgi/Mesvir1/22372/Mv17871-RA.3